MVGPMVPLLPCRSGCWPWVVDLFRGCSFRGSAYGRLGSVVSLSTPSSVEKAVGCRPLTSSVGWSGSRPVYLSTDGGVGFWCRPCLFWSCLGPCTVACLPFRSTPSPVGGVLDCELLTSSGAHPFGGVAVACQTLFPRIPAPSPVDEVAGCRPF